MAFCLLASSSGSTRISPLLTLASRFLLVQSLSSDANYSVVLFNLFPMGDSHDHLSQHPSFIGTGSHVGDMDTPGQTPAQRVIHTSDAFFRKFIHLWLLFSGLLCLYTYLWEPVSFYAALVCAGCGLVARFLVHRGNALLVRWAFITPFFILLMCAPWFVNGIRTPLLVHMMLLLIFTGWMLGTRIMWCFSAALSMMVFSLWFVESHGLWHMPAPLRGVDMYLISLQFSLILTTIVITVLIRNYRVDIQREVTWQQRLQSSLHFNTLIIDSSPVPIRVFGPDGQCLAVNNAYAQLLGHSREDLLRQSLHDSAMKNSGLTEECLQVLRTGQATDREIQVISHDGRNLWLGAHLVAFDRDGQRHLLAHFIDLTEHRRATQELKQLAFHDSLTGLANRRLLWEHFHSVQAISSRHHQWAAIMLLDLNRFKQLNDQHGHDAGDHMLIEVARRMQHTMRASDIIARLGGDEFAVLLQDMGTTEVQAAANAQMLSQKLQFTLSEPYQLGHITHYGSASIGIALINPLENVGLDELLRQADVQMYAQKKAMAAPSQDSALDI